MSTDNPMILHIRQLFKGSGKCLNSENSQQFFVLENSDGKSIFASELTDSTYGFEIDNPTQEIIYLLSVDNCLLTNSDPGKRCDCILFDNQVFCFVELKLNVHKSMQATDRLRDAREKLGTTIQFFREVFANNNKDFLGFKLEAYAVMQEHIYPRNRASRKEVFVRFLDEFGVELFEETKKTFGNR